ncbi:MAG: NAD(P)/FAD-dependent oxidoreductase [Dehalococcoidia bacterium]
MALFEYADVAIVGGGAVGCATAYYLSQAGLRVVIVEREALGSGASAHATGSFDTLAHDVTPGPYLTLLNRGAQMVKELAPALAGETGIDLYFQLRPGLRVALNEEEAAYLRSRVAEAGDGRQFISGQEAHQLEPRLSPAVVGAALVDEVIQLDSYRLTLAYAHAAERRGARVLLREVVGLERMGSEVTGLHLSTGRLPCNRVVLAMGVWNGVAQSWLDFPIPVRPLKGQSLRLQYAGEPLSFIMGGTRWGHLLSRRDGLVSCGSTEEEVDFDAHPTEEGRWQVLNLALSLMPCLEEAQVVQHLAGFRPLSADNLPLLGTVPGWEGVYLATGHGRRGIHLSAISGKLLADLIIHGTTELPLEPFLPARFAGITQRAPPQPPPDTPAFQ